MTAGKILGNSSHGDFAGSFEWCTEQVRNSTYLGLVSGLEIQKAIDYLRENSFSKVGTKLKIKIKANILCIRLLLH